MKPRCALESASNDATLVAKLGLSLKNPGPNFIALSLAFIQSQAAHTCCDDMRLVRSVSSLLSRRRVHLPHNTWVRGSRCGQVGREIRTLKTKRPFGFHIALKFELHRSITLLRNPVIAIGADMNSPYSIIQLPEMIVRIEKDGGNSVKGTECQENGNHGGAEGARCVMKMQLRSAVTPLTADVTTVGCGLASCAPLQSVRSLLEAASGAQGFPYTLAVKLASFPYAPIAHFCNVDSRLRVRITSRRSADAAGRKRKARKHKVFKRSECAFNSTYKRIMDNRGASRRCLYKPSEGVRFCGATLCSGRVYDHMSARGTRNFSVGAIAGDGRSCAFLVRIAGRKVERWHSSKGSAAEPLFTLWTSSGTKFTGLQHRTDEHTRCTLLQIRVECAIQIGRLPRRGRIPLASDVSHVYPGPSFFSARARGPAIARGDAVIAVSRGAADVRPSCALWRDTVYQYRISYSAVPVHFPRSCLSDRPWTWEALQLQVCSAACGTVAL
eukprot:IDg4976t1